MDTNYIKKEGIIKKCIEEYKDYFSSYQMQVIKSKFYTAITFNKDDEEYKKRIDEIYDYAKEALSKRKEKADKELGQMKKENAKALREAKIRNYINEKEKNTNERVMAFKDKTPLPPKFKKNDRAFKEINSIYDVREKLLTTDNIYSLFGEDHLNMELYVKTMIKHSILNYSAQNYFNRRYPSYMYARKEMFEFINSEIQKPKIDVNEFLSSIFNNEDLLRQFMYEVNPRYFDKTSKDYKAIKEEIKVQRDLKNPMLRILSEIVERVSKMELNDEKIYSLIKKNSKTL